MKNKILFGIAILLILLVVVVRYVFTEKFEAFKISISQYEISQLETLRKEKVNKITSLSNGDKNILKHFSEQFDENKAISVKDTSFTFLYLNDKIKYKTASLKYIECLHDKCIIDVQNLSNQKLISAKENELKYKFGETYSIWFPKLKDEKLLKRIIKSGECSNFFPGLSEIPYYANVWNDFEKFMIDYNFETRQAEIQKEQAESQYNYNVFSTKSQLHNSVQYYFDRKLTDRKSQIISTQTQEKTFNSFNLGVVTYYVSITTFNKEEYQTVENDAFEEQWKNNSLYTGDMPYANCFGSNNYCYDYRCSIITILTGSTDALVTIKDRNGNVVRHGYINSGYSFSFNVPDGSYQVFFYSGSGWNPYKILNSTLCGTLRGGFVANEEVTKVNYHNLNNNEWTIELILQANGNLQTQPSSLSQAL